MKYCNNILDTIGNTPLVKLNKITKGIEALILAKIEYFNPGNSIKDRMALKMIEDAEKAFLKNFINGIKYFATLNDDSVNLIQFDEKGYFVLDFSKLNKLYDMGMDLDVVVQKGKVKSDPSIELPKITIIDRKTKTKFMSIRMYRSGTGYIRNYIEKEEGLKALTKVRGASSK